jgi:hypothetical protein
VFVARCGICALVVAPAESRRKVITTCLAWPLAATGPVHLCVPAKGRLPIGARLTTRPQKIGPAPALGNLRVSHKNVAAGLANQRGGSISFEPTPRRTPHPRSGDAERSTQGTLSMSSPRGLRGPAPLRRRFWLAATRYTFG